MKNLKKLIQIILVSTTLLILSGCSDFSKEDLKKPIQDYLKTNYGIKDEFTIVYTDDNWFEGIDHQTTIEIKKPYHAYPYLLIERDTLRILGDESDDIYLELFKGAYIKQHPEVVRVVKQIIKNYGLVKYPGKVVMDADGPTYMFPYDNIQLNMIYSLELLDEFKETQKIDTIALLPTLKPSDPRNNNARYLGVVNFSFEFDINKNKHPIPNGKDIISDFQKSGVLKKGIYNIDIYVYSSNYDDYVDEDKHTSALFEVDEKGRYTIIATPKWDELDDSYFYGDYAGKFH